MEFKIGDTVEWTSQSGGFQKKKTGKIVHILSSKRSSVPYVVANENFPKHKRMFDGGSIP